MRQLLHTLLLIVFLYALSLSAIKAQSYYWFGDTDDNWSTPGNWRDEFGTPYTADFPNSSTAIVFFQNAATPDCNIDVADLTISEWNITNYNGTIRSVSNNTIDISTGTLSVTSDCTIDLSATTSLTLRGLDISAGSFLAPSQLTHLGADFKLSGASFTHNGGKVFFQSPNSFNYEFGEQVLNQVEIALGSTATMTISSPNALIANDSLVLAGGSIDAVNSRIEARGNVELRASYSGGDAKLVFANLDGINQSFFIESGAEAIYTGDIEVNQGFPGEIQITGSYLSLGQSGSQTLNLVNGYLNDINNNPIQVYNNALFTGGNGQSSIISSVACYFTGNKTLPTGSPGVLAAIEFDIPSLVTGDYILTNYSTATNYNLFDDVGIGLNNVSKEDQWQVQFVSASATPNVSTDITLHWSDAQNSDINNLSDLRVAYYNTSLAISEWIDGGNTATTGGASSGQAGTVRSNLLTLPEGISYDVTFGSASPDFNNLGGLPSESCTNPFVYEMSGEFGINGNYPVTNPANLGTTGSCAGAAIGGTSIWYEYNASGGLLDIQADNFSSEDIALEIFADDCLTLLDCANANGLAGSESITGLLSTAGTVYKIRIVKVSTSPNSVSGSFTITENIPPSATISPSEGSTNVSVDTEIQINFSTAMLNASGGTITASDITSNITISEDGTPPTPIAYSVTSFSAESFTLQPDAPLNYLTNYTVNIPANSFQDTDGLGILETTASFTTEDLPAPQVPQNFSVGTYSQGEIILNWTEEALAESYEIEVSTNNTFSSLLTGYDPLSLTAPANSATISGLADGSTYYVRIRANNTSGSSNYSPTLTVLTLASPPVLNAPAAVSANSFTLSWNPAATAIQYQIEVANNPSFLASITVSVDATATTRTFSANPGTSYYYRISTINASGTSNTSASESLVTNPVSTAASLQGSDNFTANWLAINQALTYYLDVSADNFSTLLIDDLDVGNVTSYEVTGLSSGTAYQYRIRAENTDNYISNSSNAVTTATLPDAPTALAASDIETDSFRANWELLATANGYYLDVSSDNFSTFVTGYNNRDVGNTDEFDVVGLNPDTEYQYRVRAYTVASTSGNSNIIIVNTLPLPADSPVAFAASGVSQNSFTANWDLVLDASSYEIDVATDAGFVDILASYNALDVGDVSSALISGLAAGNTYYYRVRAVNSGGVSANSNIISQVTVPAAPLATAATSISANGFTANWNNVVGANSYYLDVSDDEFFGSFLPGYQDLEVFTNSAILTGLVSGTTYYYRVRAVNDGGLNISPYSGTRSVLVSATGGGGTPTVPSGLEAYTFFPGEVELAWFDNSNNETGFELQRSTTPGTGFSTVATLPANTEFYIDNDGGAGLPENTTFYYRLRALGASANSNYTGEVSVTTVGNVPEAPSEVVGFTLSNSSILLTWINNADNQDGFIVNRYDEDFNVTMFTVTDTFYVDAGLAGETCYYYDVQAFNSSGDSDFSNFILACTSPVPTAPNGLTAVAVSSNQIELSWNDNSSDEELFVIEIDDLIDEEGFIFLETTNAGENTFTVDESVYGLQGNVRYRFRVSAYNSFGDSPYSNIATVFTPVDPDVTPPNAPSNLVAESVTLQEIALTWRDNASDELYFTVERSLTGLPGDFLPIALVPFNQVAYNNTGLDPNTEYFYRVRANNQGGASAYTEITSAVSECNIVAIMDSDIDGGTACNTKNVLLEFTSNVTSGRYQWRRNGRVIPDANLPVYYASQTGEYTCEVSSGDCRKSALKSIIIVPSFTLEIGLDDNNRLISSFLGADNYQWFYNYEPINGANNDTYIPTQPGIYYLVVSNEGCSATSNIVEFDITTGSEDFNLSSGIKLSPNPSDYEVQLELNSSVKGQYQINLISLKGEKVLLQQGEKQQNRLEIPLDVSRFAQGIYTVEVICGKYRGQKKLLIY